MALVASRRKVLSQKCFRQAHLTAWDRRGHLRCWTGQPCGFLDGAPSWSSVFSDFDAAQRGPLMSCPQSNLLELILEDGSQDARVLPSGVDLVALQRGCSDKRRA